MELGVPYTLVRVGTKTLNPGSWMHELRCEDLVGFFFSTYFRVQVKSKALVAYTLNSEISNSQAPSQRYPPVYSRIKGVL